MSKLEQLLAEPPPHPVLGVGGDPEFAGILLSGGKDSRNKFKWQNMGILAAGSVFFPINDRVFVHSVQNAIKSIVRKSPPVPWTKRHLRPGKHLDCQAPEQRKERKQHRFAAF